MRSRTIDVFLFDGVNLLDVSGPVQAFEAASQKGEPQPYVSRYVTLDGAPVRASCGLRLVPDGPLRTSPSHHDLLIPGGEVDPLLTHKSLRDIIRQKAAQSGDGRLISVCSGALLLAAAGVLDGHRATTHWTREAQCRTYSEVLWDLDRISTSDRGIFTSAGVTTGIDLALSIIRLDYGPTVALRAARELVVQLRRTGGQSQYTMHLAGQFSHGETLARLIEKIVAQPHLDWSIEAMASTANMNSRTLARHFKRDMFMPPAQFVERVRVDHARGLLLENIPLKQVAADSGFGDLQRMRRAFQRRFGIHVSDYLNAFGGNR